MANEMCDSFGRILWSHCQHSQIWPRDLKMANKFSWLWFYSKLVYLSFWGRNWNMIFLSKCMHSRRRRLQDVVNRTRVTGSSHKIWWWWGWRYSCQYIFRRWFFTLFKYLCFNYWQINVWILLLVFFHFHYLFQIHSIVCIKYLYKHRSQRSHTNPTKSRYSL